jgi:polygalacturonase
MRTLALSLNTYLARGLRSCIAARLHLLPSGLKGKKVMKISNIGNPALSLLLAVFGTCLVALVPPAMAQTTGDSRTVTEPVFPAVCSQLSAAITEVNNDIPTTVDATVTNPDGARIQAALNSWSTGHPGDAVELSMDPTGAYNAFLSGPLSMPSNVTLLVDPGVTLFFSRNAADYYKSGSTCGTVNSGSSTSSCKPLIDVPSGAGPKTRSFPHSSRSATMGSTSEARRAGTKPANAATAANNSAARKSMRGSVGVTP